MKKTIYKSIAFFGIMGTALFATSCLKDNYNNFAAVPEIIEFLDATPGTAISLSADSTKLTDDIYYVRVNQTGHTATNVDISYTVAVDPSQIAVYNADTTHVTAVLVTDTVYVLATSGVIKAGKDTQNNPNRTDSVKLTIHPSKVPHALGVNYLLPITIQSASAGTISGNYKTILYNFFHNIYDGTYNATVTRYNFNTPSDYAGWDPVAKAPKAGSAIASQSATPFTDWNVLTVNATRSTMYAGNLDGGFGTMDFIVNPDNTVNVKSTAATGLNAVIDLPGATSIYDPSTKTFHIYYEYTNVDANGNPTTFRVLKVDMTHQ